MNVKWTENDVLRVLADPAAVLAGIVTEDEFIATGVRMIKDVGAERYIRMVITNIRTLTGVAS